MQYQSVEMIHISVMTESGRSSSLCPTAQHGAFISAVCDAQVRFGHSRAASAPSSAAAALCSLAPCTCPVTELCAAERRVELPNDHAASTLLAAHSAPDKPPPAHFAHFDVVILFTVIRSLSLFGLWASLGRRRSHVAPFLSV